MPRAKRGNVAITSGAGNVASTSKALREESMTVRSEKVGRGEEWRKERGGRGEK
jgi:hypothetical protein